MLKTSFFVWIFKNKTKIGDLYFKLLFSWLPVKKNKIVFCNYYGCGYGCNPKYIAEEIIRQKLNYELVWIVKKEFKKTDFPPQIRIVDYNNLNACLFEYATSKVWIDNARKTNLIELGLTKKKKQLYINTWHGSLGIKKIDGDMNSFINNEKWRKPIKKEYNMVDIRISNSEFETNVYKSAMWCDKKIIEIGHPRNDILINNDFGATKKKVFEKLKIMDDKKIILYVPSYRDNLRISCFDLDYEKLYYALKQKTGEDWLILSRFHPENLLKLKYLSSKSVFQYDVSMYPDIQELLKISDIIISDYSSVMFDFMLTRKPCFIYANDIEKYNNERGFYYPLESTPFPIAKNNVELVENILNFDNEKYVQDVDEFLRKKNAIENGTASFETVEVIKEFVEKL